MSRSSEIVRAGYGGRVEVMAANGDTAPMIAAAISEESGKPFSAQMVHRYIQKRSLNAAVVSPETTAIKRLAAAIAGVADVRDSAESSYFGTIKLNTTNKFTLYYGLARKTGYGPVESAFEKIALKITRGARIVGREQDAEKIRALSTALDFSNHLQDVVRSTFEMGTTVVNLKDDNDIFIKPQILPMEHITLLTEHETPGTVSDTLVKGAVTQIILDEGEDTQQEYTSEDAGLIRRWHGGNKFTDTNGNVTWGLYGRSLTIGLEMPLKILLNGLYHYSTFIEQYGMGRYVQNMKALAELVINKVVSREAAEVARNETMAAMQKMGANENIVTVGDEIRMMDSRTGFDIMPYFKWLETLIDRTLLQSDVAAGKVGSEWTSAGTAVSAQDYDLYESSRNSIFEQIVNEVIIPQCASSEFNINPKTISIAATPFLRVDVPYQTLLDMHDRGIITDEQLLDRAGFPAITPDEV